MRKNKGVRVFQSTPPRRRRPVAQAEADRDSISIHASAKEATIAGAADKLGYAISIHASAKEATNIALLADLMGHISIHASAKEATYADKKGKVWHIFQSTPPRRRRQYFIN